MQNKLSQRHLLKLSYIKEVLEKISQISQICFRGGTALSLSYEIIERFSEDIDLTFFKGELSHNQILVSLKEVLEKIKWKDKIEHDSEKKLFTIYFKNNEPEPNYQAKFLSDRIIIEYPQKNISKDKFKYELIHPFKNANFSMPVMSIDHIFVDKASILIEKFSETNSMQWAIKDRASARHIYDVQLIMQKKKIKAVDQKYLKSRIYDVTLKKEDGNFRGINSEYIKNKNQYFSLSIEKGWEKFKNEMKKEEENILTVLSVLVYPGAERFDLKWMIREYEKIFRFIFSYIKKNIGIKKQI